MSDRTATGGTLIAGGDFALVFRRDIAELGVLERPRKLGG